MKYGLMLALGLLLPQIRAQVVEEERNASALFGGGAVGESHPNVDLPKQVIAPAGKLTLYADYEHAGDEGIPLYLVNRSEKWISFGVQDGDLCIKLEVQNPDGEWQRAQVHLSNWCGNSFGCRPLPAGHHFSLLGYQPHHGIEAKVRYACFGQVEVISNVGKGCYLPKDVEAAREDDIARRGFPDSLRSTLILHSIKRDPFVIDQRLQEEVGMVSLELVRILGGNLDLKKKAQQWLEQLSAQEGLTNDEGRVVATIKSVLARPWASEMDRQRLLNYCSQALQKPPPKVVVYGSPESIRSRLWLTLIDLTEPLYTSYDQPPPIPAQSWKSILELAADRVMTAPEEEQKLMIRFLSMQATLADEWLADAIFEPFLSSDNASLVDLATQTLSRRAHWERLAELGWKLSPPSQLKVLSALLSGQSPEPSREFDGYGGLRTPLPDSEEERYWQHCMSAYPSECAEVCYEVSSRNSLAMPNLPYLEEQLFVYLLALVAHDDVEYEVESGEQKARAVLAFLVPETDGRALLPDLEPVREGRSVSDLIALLNRLLAHPGYITEKRQNSSGGDLAVQETRRFVFRLEASKALERFGQSVPKDLVIERQVTPTPETSK